MSVCAFGRRLEGEEEVLLSEEEERRVRGEVVPALQEAVGAVTDLFKIVLDTNLVQKHPVEDIGVGRRYLEEDKSSIKFSFDDYGSTEYEESVTDSSSDSEYLDSSKTGEEVLSPFSFDSRRRAAAFQISGDGNTGSSSVWLPSNPRDLSVSSGDGHKTESVTRTATTETSTRARPIPNVTEIGITTTKQTTTTTKEIITTTSKTPTSVPTAQPTTTSINSQTLERIKALLEASSAFPYNLLLPDEQPEQDSKPDISTDSSTRKVEPPPEEGVEAPKTTTAGNANNFLLTPADFLRMCFFNGTGCDFSLSQPEPRALATQITSPQLSSTHFTLLPLASSGDSLEEEEVEEVEEDEEDEEDLEERERVEALVRACFYKGEC